ncbi:MAG: hypothetical protein IIA67_13085 [Planctomycetes bacterium]|nr:hypothetical protein [Planctomycetota bacterium]
MNVQRFGMAAVAVFVVYAVIYIGSGMIFVDQYAAVMEAFGMNESETWMNWAGRILFTLVFVYIFVQGHENKGIAEGVRYGFLIGLLMVGGPWRKQASTPGDLASHHSEFADQCSACHVGTDGTLDELLHAALTSEDASALDRRCLECHRDLRPAAGHPHNVDPGLLAERTQEARKQHTAGGGPLMTRMAKGAFGHDGSISCARCHREHQGVDHNLAAMSDAQCQTCHVSAFESFSHGHAEFSSYPYMRRSRIHFDHVAHYGVHFRDAGRLPDSQAARAFVVKGEPLEEISQETCAQCHVSDRAGRKMLVRRFEQTCGACHAEQIGDNLSPGLLVLGFPVFDTHRLGDEAAAAWPPRRAKHAEARGTLSPILRILLSGKADFAALDRQTAAFDLSNLEGASPEQLAAAKKLPALLRRELDLLATEGRAGVQQRLAQVFGSSASSDQIAQMAKLIPTDYLGESRTHWFGGAAAPDVGAGGVYRRDRELSLRYRPNGHADPLLRAWIDAVVRAEGSDGDDDNDAASPLDQLRRSLTHVSSSGRCLKCHTIERGEDGAAFVHWQSYQGASLGSFTTFAHRPHVVIMRDDSCLECHKLSTPAAPQGEAAPYRPEYFAAGGYARVGGKEHHANFQKIGKAACSSCHTTGRVTQSCTTCHRYHVRRPENLGQLR